MPELFQNNLHSTLIPTKVASEISGYNADYLGRLCREKKIQGTQVGRAWLINRTSLESFVKEQEDRKLVRSEELRIAREKEYRKAQKPILKSAIARASATASDATKVFADRMAWSRARAQTFATRTTRTLHSTPRFSLETRSPRMAALAVALAVVAGSAFASSDSHALSFLNAVPNAAVQLAFNSQTSLERSSSFRVTVQDTSDTNLAAALPTVPDSKDASRSFALLSSSSSMTALATVHSLTDDARAPFAQTDIAHLADGRIAFVADAAHDPLGTLARAYVGVGETFFNTNENIERAYLSGIMHAGDATLAAASMTRDGIAFAPKASNAILNTYIRGIYAWNDAAPKTAGTVVLALYDTGSSLSTHTAEVPAIALQAQTDVVEGAANSVHSAGPSAASRLALNSSEQSKQEAAVSTPAASATANTQPAAVALSSVTQPITNLYASAVTATGAVLSLPIKAENTILGVAGYTSAILDGTDLPSNSPVDSVQVAQAGSATDNATVSANTTLPANVLSFLPASWQQMFANFFHTTSTLARALFSSGLRFIATLFPSGSVMGPTLTVLHIGPTETLALPVPADVSRGGTIAYTGGSNTLVQNVVNNYYPQALIGGVFNDAVLAVVRPFVNASIAASLRVNRGGSGGGGGGGVQSDGATLTNVTITSGTATLSTLDSSTSSLGDADATTLTAGSTTLATTTVNGDLNVSGTITANTLSVSNLSSNSAIIAPFFTATDTAATSTFTNLSATNITASSGLTAANITSTGTTSVGSLTIGALSGFLKATAGAIGTSLIDLSTDVTSTLPTANGGTGSTSLTGILKGNGTGPVLTAVDGTDYISAATYGGSFYSYFHATTTDALAEGSTNKYYTDARVNSFIAASSTIPKLFSTNIWTGSNTFAASNFALTGLADGCVELSSGQFTSTGTNCGTGSGGITSLNGLTANSQLFATSTSGGLDLHITSSGSTHTFAIAPAAGFSIPLTASTTDWNTAFLNRITSASAPLSIASNTISISQAGSGSDGYLSSVDWNTFNSKQAALTFTYPLVNSANTVSLAFGTTTSNTWAGTQTFGNILATNATTTSLGINSETFTDLTGTGLQNVGGVLTLNATGDWTGTFDGHEGTFYLDRANHTGTQLASTISDFNSTARGLFSSTATGLTYTSGTGVFSLTSGYTIPLTASTTDWNTAYLNRITSASAPLSIAGNVISISQAGTGSDGYLSSTDFNTFNNKQAALTFTYPLVNSANTISLAFGTTTSNTWGGTQTFTNTPVLGSLTGVLYGNGGTLASVATSTPTLGTGLAYSGTLGAFVGGTSGTLSVSTTSISGSGSNLNADFLDGLDSPYFLANSYSTTSANYWLTTKTTSDLTEGSNLYYTSGRATANFVSNLAATTSVNSITTLANLSLPLSQTTGVLAQANGGTGISSYTAGDILYADNSGNLAKLAVGSTGQVLKVQAGLPSWGVDQTVGSGGSGDGIFATSTNLIYPIDTASTVVIGNNATSTNNSIFEVIGQQYISSKLGIASTSPSAALSVVGNGIISGNFWAGGIGTFGNIIDSGLTADTLTYANGSKQLSSASITAPLAFSSGTLSITQANASTNGFLSSTDWNTFNNKVSTTRAINTTYPLQGGGDLSADRTLTLAFGTTTSNTWAGTQTFGNLIAANATTTSLTLGSDYITDLTGSGLTVTGNALTLDRTGDWTGTFDGQEGTFYLNRANHTGTQLASTISDFNTAVNSFVAGSTTIPKTYTANTFTGAQVFSGGVTIGTLNGPLQANSGVVSATSSIGVLYGGTGLTTAPTYGQLLVGNSSGGYTLTATSSLGLVTSAITSIGPTGQMQTGPTVTVASSTSSFNGLTVANTIVGSGNTLTLTPSLSGTLNNSGLTNSTVSYGGVTLSLGDSDATPAFDLTDATNLPIVGGTTGTLTVARGGTGATSFTAGNLLYGSGTGALQSVATTTLSGNSQVAVSNSPVLIGASPAVLSIVADSIGDTQLAFNTGQNLTTASSPTFASLTLTAPLTVPNGGTGWASIQSGAVLYGNGTGALSTTTAGTAGNVLALLNGIPTWTATTTAGTGLTYSSGSFNVNTTQNIAKLSNLTSNGFVKTSAGDGTLSIDTNTYLTSALTSIGPAGQLQTGPAVTLASSTTGTDFTVTASGNTITFNLPTASASNRGLLTSTDWSTFNSKQAALTFTYPLVNSANTISLAFGTTTSNTWAGTQTFTNAPILGSLTGVVYGNGGVLATKATSTPTLGLGLSGTLTTLGSSDTLSIATSSLYTGTTGQFPYFSGTNTLTATSSIFVATNQNIGIGTTTPAKTLSIQGNGLFSGDLSVANLTATGTVAFTGLGTGLVKSTSGTLSIAVSGTDYAPATSGSSILYGNGAGGFSNASVSSPLTFSGGFLGIQVANTSQPGYLTSTDWNTFNNKVSTTRAINTTYPLQGGGDLSADRTLTLAFGTTTSNTWAGTQTFTNTPVLAALSGLVGANNGALYQIATSTNFVTSAVAGTGIGVSGATGAVTISNTGVLSLAQTYGSAQTGAITFATSTATSFNGLTISNAITNSGAAFTFAPDTITGTLNIAGGGTGITSVSDGRLVIGGTTATALTSLATSTGGTILQTSFTTGRPSWVATSTLNIAISDTAGTLTVARGGTGQSTFTSSQLLYGNGTNALSSVATTTLSGNSQVAVSNSPVLIGASPAVLSIVADSIGDTQLAFNTGQNLTTASSPTFAALTLTAPLTVANGGTGSTTLTGILKGNGTGVVQTAVAGTDYQAAGNYITALTGDVSATGPGSVAATLATVNGNVGSFGGSTAIPNFTVNGKGLITAAGTSAVIAPAGTLTGTTLASNVVTSSLTSVGTLTALTVSGNTSLSNSTSTNEFSGRVTANTAAFGQTGSTTISSTGALSTPSLTIGTLSGLLYGNSGAVAAASVSSPLLFSSGTLSIQDAAADGTTKGAAAFDSNDFNSSSGLISIDYNNGQKASGSLPGFLSSADWTTFNNKENPLTFTYPLTRSTNTISLAFGTTTSNTWGGTQTFTNAIGISSGGTNSSSQTTNGVAYFNGTSITTGSVFTYNGTNVQLSSGSFVTGTQFIGLTADSTSAPSFTWATDLNTGLYHPATGAIGFVSAGTEAARFTTQGFLGIGTTTPKFSLQIASSTGPQLALSDGSATQSPWTLRSISGSFYLATSSVTTFATSTSAALSIDTNGTVTLAKALTVPNGGSGATTLTGLLIGNGTSAFTATTLSSGISGQISDETGSGALVFGTSPTLVTPALGTPSSGTLTNTTGFPVANLAGAGAGVLTFLATPSSANLASALTDETGTGVAVFGTSPTFTTGITTPLVIGGTGTASTLTLRSTSGTGGTGADIIFQTGTNGGTEAMRILNSGFVGIGTSTPQWLLNPFSSTAAQLSLSAGAGVAQWAFRNAGGNLYLATTTVVGTATTTTSALTVLGASGNVGIGSTSPSQLLSVGGSAYITGNAGIGGGLSSQAVLQIGQANPLTGTTQTGVLVNLAATAAATTDVRGVQLSLTSGPGVTTADVRGFYAAGFTVGSGGTVTRSAKFEAFRDATATNNAGLYYGSGLTWTGNYGIYMDTTDNNYFGGNVGIGTTSPVNSLTLRSDGASYNTLASFIDSTSNGIPLVKIGKQSESGNDTGLALAYDNANNVGWLGVAGDTVGTGIQLKRGGNVGIGNTAPSTALDAQGIITTRSAVADTPTSPTESLRMSLTGFTPTTDYRNSIFNSVSATAALSSMHFRLSNGTASQATVMSLLGNGNVGIGETAPVSALHVAGAVGSTLTIDKAGSVIKRFNLFVGDGTGGTTADENYIKSLNTTLHFMTGATGTTEIVTFSSSGNVGIGMVPATNGNTQLAVQQGGFFAGGVSDPAGLSAAGTFIGYNIASSYGFVQAIQTAVATKPLVFQPSGGNVGIGSTTPNQLLTVSGGRIAIDDAGGNIGNIFTGSSGGLTALHVGTLSNTPLALFTNSSGPQVVLATSGNFGVGTTTPWRKLSVTGTVAFDGLTSAAGGNAVCITTNKDITNSGGNTCNLSSIKFKENVATLPQGSAIDEINKLRVVSFDYKKGYYSPEELPGSYGVIAEEVEKVDPKLVDYGYDGKPLTVHFEKLTGLTLQAVQELSQRTDQLSLASTTFASQLSIASSTFSSQINTLSSNFATAFANIELPHALTATTLTANSINIAQGVSAGTMTAQSANVDGTVSAARYIVPQTANIFSFGSTTISMTVPHEALASGNVDLYKLAGYATAGVDTLAARADLLAVKLDDLTTRVAALEAMGAATTTDATTDAQGAAGLALTTIEDALKSIGIIIHKGYLALDSLVTHQLFLVKGDDGTSSTGSEIIPAGATELNVINPLVHPSSKIFLTFTSSVDGSWYLSKKEEGRFTITLSKSQPTDTEFDYFLIQTDTNAQVASTGDSPPPGSQEAPPAPGPISVDGGPVVTLNGDAASQIPQGATWTDPGAQATAADGTDLTSSITVAGVVDANTAGLYTITYHVTDAAGKEGQASRVVTVLAPTTAPSDGGAVTQAPPTDGGAGGGDKGGDTVSAGPDASPAS